MLIFQIIGALLVLAVSVVACVAIRGLALIEGALEYHTARSRPSVVNLTNEKGIYDGCTWVPDDDPLPVGVLHPDEDSMKEYLEEKKEREKRAKYDPPLGYDWHKVEHGGV